MKNIKQALKQIYALKERAENRKCCGNCGLFKKNPDQESVCKFMQGNEYCKSWESDKQTTNQRKELFFKSGEKGEALETASR